MMQPLKFISFTGITILLVYILNGSIGSIPPPGKILDPVHGFMANAETSDALKSEIIDFDNQGIKGTIYMDERLVPHIFAEDDYSLYFLQGFITAKYRLWQMDIQSRAASGRLSEILGKDLLNYDREQRRMGMVMAAEIALEELKKDDETFSCVDAYTKGVNYFIHQTGSNDKNMMAYQSMPIEFKLLNYQPEDWTYLKTMLLLKYMSKDLTGFDDDIEYTNNLKLLGRKNFDLLFPDRPAGIDPIIPSEKVYDFIPIKIETPHIDSANQFFSQSSFSSQHSSEDEGILGSNNWVIGASKTKNGHPILCNDPHLQLNLPALWYEIQLHSPKMNCYGASLPGAPAIVIGFNDSIAWGVTNAGRDVRDWYQIDFIDSSKSAYQYGNSIIKTSKRIETIHVKGEKDVIDTVIYTHYGPLVYDGTEKNLDGKINHSIKERANLAMKWTALEPSSEFKTFYLLNRAKNYQDYRIAISFFECPAQNFLFACVNNDIAITQQGNFPVKWKEQGRFLLNGNDTLQDWQAYIPVNENPTIKNPERGFCSSANQHPTDSTYPYYYTSFEFEFYRNRVINNTLSGMQSATVEDMKQLQQNNFNLKASEILPFMLQNLNIKNDETALMLSQWNYMNDADKKEPVYFQIWWDTLYQLLWDEFENTNIAFIQPNSYNTVQAMKNLPADFLLFDNQSTKNKKETLGDILLESYEAMIHITDSIKAEDKIWYKYKNTSIMHIAQLEPFSKTEIHNGGYSGIVNASSHTHGPSWRMIVELSSPINALGVYPGGQSGNPGSKYYDSFIEDWAEGNYYQLHLFKTEEEAKSKSVFLISTH